MLRKGEQLLIHKWHLSCYSNYKHGDKSRMRKEPEGVKFCFLNIAKMFNFQIMQTLKSCILLIFLCTVKKKETR